MRSLRAVLSVGSLIAVVSLVWLGSVGHAQAPAAGAIDRGRVTFLHTCAACHGDHADGKGPAAAALTPRPADLTTIMKREGAGRFPTQAVEATIKGTGAVRAHGSQGMMVWGVYFLADANGNQAEADARVSDVVAFIQSVQAK
jgi:mono/diheme cytochrome c family protein